MNALIGALRVSLSAETAQFEAGMKRAQRTANQTNSAFKKSFGGLGNIVKAGFAGVVSGISIGLITQGVKAALDYAGSLGEISQQLGVTTKDLQVFRFAAGQVGVSQEQLETGLSKLTITLGRVAAGAKAPIAALNAIGISVDQLKGKDTGEAFRIIADGLEKVTDRSQRAAVEVALFGKAGAQLDNLLSGGSSAINELSAAAERLGIVLSDEQIQKADDTADRLDALKTVLSAQIAGVVADNADAILGLANALAQIAAVSGRALTAFGNFISFASKNIGFLANLPAKIATGGLVSNGNVQGLNKAGKSVTISLPSTKPKAASGGVDIGKFLAGGGGGAKKGRSGSDDAERKRQEALRDAFQFDQELLRAQQDVLRAQQQLSTDYSERAALSIQMLNLEQQSFQREMEYAVASGDLTKAQAAQLEAEFAKTDALERQAVLQEEETRRREDYAMLDEKDFDIKMDILEKQADLADTWQERRAIEHKILDLAYEEERNRLERIVRESQDWAEIEAARRDLLALTQKQALDRQGVNRNTMGPFESAQVQFGDLSEEMENLRVNGIMAAGDALATLATEGFGSFKDAAISAIKSVIAEFIRLQTIKFLFNAIGGAMGAPSIPGVSGGLPTNFTGPRFATGGAFTIMGNPGVDKNVMSLNGLPIARVSHGERVNISNDNGGRSGGGSITNNFTISGPVSRQTELQISSAVRRGVAQANRKGA